MFRSMAAHSSVSLSSSAMEIYQAASSCMVKIDDQLYFIATRHKETLWDFADALREYGFIDAIYITGGADYVFYRDKDGFRHDIGDKSDYPHTKWKGIIPWLVFRN